MIKMEIKTTVELLNGKITKAEGYLSVKYAETQLNKKWVTVDSEITFCNLIKDKLKDYKCAEHKKLLRLINKHIKKLTQK